MAGNEVFCIYKYLQEHIARTVAIHFVGAVWPKVEQQLREISPASPVKPDRWVLNTVGGVCAFYDMQLAATAGLPCPPRVGLDHSARAEMVDILDKLAGMLRTELQSLEPVAALLVPTILANRTKPVPTKPAAALLSLCTSGQLSKLPKSMRAKMDAQQEFAAAEKLQQMIELGGRLPETSTLVVELPRSRAWKHVPPQVSVQVTLRSDTNTTSPLHFWSVINNLFIDLR